VAGKVTAESNGSLPPGSAPGPTLGNECGKRLPFFTLQLTYGNVSLTDVLIWYGYSRT